MKSERSEEKLPYFAPLRGSGSLIILIASILTNVLLVFCLLRWIYLLFFRKCEPPKRLAEVWVISLLVLQLYILFYYRKPDGYMWLVGVYGLIDVLGATLGNIVVSLRLYHDDEGGFIQVRDRLRWLLMALLNLVQVVVCFAMLFMYYGDQFIPRIEEPLMALYHALTFTTLGQGDIRPACGTGRVIVCLELFFFLIFVAIKLPIAISVVRVKEKPRSK